MKVSRRIWRLSVSVVLVAILAVALTTVGSAQKPEKLVVGHLGMVAAAHPLAAEAGLEMLKRGGNAVDAAVATAFAVGVVEPQASGIGGEGMLIIYAARDDKAVAIDFKAQVPKVTAEKLSEAKPPKLTGYASVGIPGTVAGLALALEKHGTKSLSEVMQPAIRLAENGFPVPKTLADLLVERFDVISKNAELAKVFLKDGLPLPEGAILRNPDYAASLHKIAQGGPDVFYKGEIADAIVADMAANGGFITKEDLAQYKAAIRFPVRSTYRGYTILTGPPPVTSVAVAEALNVLENFDLASWGNLSFQNMQVITEAMRQVTVDRRTYVGDPDFHQVPIEGMLSKDYAKTIAQRISFDKMTPADAIKPGDFNAKTGALLRPSLAATGTDGQAYESPSTTQISVVDSQRNMVSLTYTLSSFFGAGVMVKGTGIILNNQMGNVVGPPTAPTGPQPYKRVVTTISPTIVLKNGKPWLAIGTPGASRIMQTLVTVLSNIIDHKMPLDKAIDAPRFFVGEGSSPAMDFEARVPADVVEKFKALGYKVKTRPDYDLYFGGVQAVMIDDSGNFIGAADPRRDGAAAGF